MVLQLAKDPSQRLLKHVVRCYSRLSDNPRFYVLFFCLVVVSQSISVTLVKNHLYNV